MTPPLFAHQDLSGSHQAVGDIARHTPVFNIDERTLQIGAAILAETARRFLTGEA